MEILKALCLTAVEEVKLKMNEWSEEQLQFLKENCHKITIKQLMKTINKSRQLIVKKIKELNLKQFKYKTTHNLSKNKYYILWKNVRSRCYNKKDICYNTYGGRGIYMYQDWINNPLLFINYIKETLGEKPKNYSLDRIDNNEGYIPNNLKWSSSIEQVRNSSMTKLTLESVNLIREQGNNFTKTELSKKYNISLAQISRIINNKSWVINE